MEGVSMEHSTDNHELSDRVLPPDYRASFIERSVAKGYPPEIFAGLRTEKEFGEAMGTFMKERYISRGYPRNLFIDCHRTVEVTEKAREYEMRQHQRSEKHNKEEYVKIRDSFYFAKNKEKIIGEFAIIAFILIPVFVIRELMSTEITPLLYLQYLLVLYIICRIIHIIYREFWPTYVYKKIAKPVEATLVTIKNTAPVIAPEVIQLSPEDKVFQIEQEAILAERTANALLKKREAARKLKKAQDEDAIEAARLQRQLDKEKNSPPPPPPPMTQAEKMKALEALKERENAEVARLRALGYKEDSNAIDDVRVFYEKELKTLLNNTRYAK